MDNTYPMLFAVKRYALHDGPNIRTTIFFKGCPLNCFWCHNPEGISSDLEVVTIQAKCIGCRECLEGCPESALIWINEGIERDDSRCSRCLNCVEICPSLAHEAIGWESDLDTIIREIEKDLPFFDHSKGGVTFSGGEPLYQAEQLIELLKRCGELDIHRTVDTSGFAETDVLLEVAKHTELFLYDLKHMDSIEHKKYTGVPNEPILANLRKLAQTTSDVRVRLPLVATINDSQEHIQVMAEFLRDLPHISEIDILPYHDLAGAKYKKLSRTDSTSHLYIPSSATIDRIRTQFEAHGLSVVIDG